MHLLKLPSPISHIVLKFALISSLTLKCTAARMMLYTQEFTDLI